MTELVIRHCTFRVVRQSGWSWGGDPRGLVERVTKLAPQLIGEWLASLFANREGEIAAPVRLRIKLPRSALRSAAAFEQALRSALSRESSTGAFEALISALPLDPDQQIAERVQPAAPEAETRAPVTPPTGLRALLLRWREDAQLLHRLRGLPKPTARLWLEWLAAQLIDRRITAARRTAAAEEIATLRARLRQAVPELGDDARIDLAILVELLARHRAELTGSEVALLLKQADRVAEQNSEQNNPPDPALPGNLRDAAQATTQLAVPHAETARVIPAIRLRRHAPQTDVHLTSVLPFLALGMLARIGWLDVANASIEALALPDRGAILAAALADMLVPLPGPAARASELRLQTVASFAGLVQAPAPAAFAAWNRVAGDGLGALGGFVADTVAEGHDPDLPLLVTRLSGAQAGTWLLADADGGYPVALAADLPEFLSAIDRFRASVLLVTRDAASPALMAALAQRERGLVIDAPPARGEVAERMRGHPGLWCTPHDFPSRQIAAAAACFETTAAMTGALVGRLLGVRAPDALNGAAFLAASMGLGLLGWKLWRERDPPHPLLALGRLGSLDGTARFTGDAIEVRPSVGQRYLDLKSAGVLDSVAGVPWLEGRSVRFIGP